MIKPEVLPKDYQAVKLATVFDAPMVMVPHVSALPWNELIASIVFSYWSKTRQPQRTWYQNALTGVLMMLVTLGSEWAHNLAHALAAKLTGKPVDAIRVVFGMPLLVYHDLNDSEVTPRQHILRAIGGPGLNLSLIPLARSWQKRSSGGTISRDAADAAMAMNCLLLVAGLQPIPGLDGGVILKWVLVDRGQSILQADDSVRKANWISGASLAASSVMALKRRKRLVGGLLGLLAGISFVVAKGWLKET